MKVNLAQSTKSQISTAQQRLLNGMTIKIAKNCNCKDIKNEIQHDFFRHIIWTTGVFRYLNKIQDHWSITNSKTYIKKKQE